MSIEIDTPPLYDNNAIKLNNTKVPWAESPLLAGQILSCCPDISSTSPHKWNLLNTKQDEAMLSCEGF